MSNPIIPEDILRLSREKAAQFNQILTMRGVATIEPGQIWSTHAIVELPEGRRFETEDPRLVVILYEAGHPSGMWEQVTAAPISLFISMASEYDLICTRSVSPLGFDFMAEVWNETPVIKKHLKQYLGKLADEAIEAISDLYKCKLMEEEIPSTLSKWIGPRLMGEDDPRVAFQEAEVEAAGYLGKAASAALALEVTAIEPETTPVRVSQKQRSFVVQPILKKLSEVLHRPAIAFAAGIVEEETYVVNGSESDDYFTFELLANRRSPYEVYFLVHELSQTLIGRDCMITVETPSAELNSVPTELQLGTRIQVGEDYAFRPDRVQSIKVNIQ